MHVLRELCDLEEVADPELLGLIRQRIEDTAEYVEQFGELVFFVIVQAGDGIEQVEAVLGFPILVNRFDGVAYGEPGFAPSWEVLAEHAGWYELVYVLSDDGAGVQVFVAKEGAPTDLLAMCRQFAQVETDT